MSLKFLAGQVTVCCCLVSLPEFPAGAQANAPAGSPTLRGIATWPGRQLVLFQASDNSRRPPREFILGPGEREEDLEVVGVSGRSVNVRSSAGSLELRLPGGASDEAPTETTNQACSLQLDQAEPELLLRLYQELAGRTLLRPSRALTMHFTVPHTNTATKFQLLRALDSALADKGLSIQPNRDKFAIVSTREGDFAKVSAQLWDMVAGLFPETSPDVSAELAPGMINFPATDLNQGLMVFQELAGRAVVRPATLPAPTLTLRTMSQLSRAEAVYAIAATLALNDLSIRPAGEKLLLVFPTVETKRVEKLLERTVAARGTDTMPGRRMTDINLARAPLAQVAGVFQDLLGQPVEIAPSLSRPVFNFRSPKQLTREEAVYGLELLLELNGISAIPRENGPGVKLVPSASVH